MGRREMEHEGGKEETGKRGNPRPSCCPAPRSGALAVGGYKRPRGRERGLYVSARSPARPTFSYESPGKFAKVVDVPGVLQVLAIWRCEPVSAGGSFCFDYEGALPLGLQLALGLRPSCSDEYEVPFAELPSDDCAVTPCFGLGLVFV
jgi:hypothetical protein